MTMKKASAKAPAQVRRFAVKLEIRGTMVDKDTPISRQALIDLFEMHFACPKGLKVVRVDAEEMSD